MTSEQNGQVMRYTPIVEVFDRRKKANAAMRPEPCGNYVHINNYEAMRQDRDRWKQRAEKAEMRVASENEVCQEVNDEADKMERDLKAENDQLREGQQALKDQTVRIREALGNAEEGEDTEEAARRLREERDRLRREKDRCAIELNAALKVVEAARYVTQDAHAPFASDQRLTVNHLNIHTLSQAVLHYDAHAEQSDQPAGAQPKWHPYECTCEECQCEGDLDAQPAKPTPPEGPFYDDQRNRYRLKYYKPCSPKKGEYVLSRRGRVVGPLNGDGSLKNIWIVEPADEPTPPEGPFYDGGVKCRLTGEYRPPRKGEHYLGTHTVLRALQDHVNPGHPRWIVEPDSTHSEPGPGATALGGARDPVDDEPEPGEPAPCPWCGNPSLVNTGKGWAAVECGDDETCCAAGPMEVSRGDAVAAWNRIAQRQAEPVEASVYPSIRELLECWEHNIGCGWNRDSPKTAAMRFDNSKWALAFEPRLARCLNALANARPADEHRVRAEAARDAARAMWFEGQWSWSEVRDFLRIWADAEERKATTDGDR